MPAAKKTSPTTAAPKKAASAPSHPSYKDMIKEAILSLKERNGSSRPALKKYILANHKSLAASPAVFDQQFNKALRTGVEKGEFHQPKGSSGTVKLAKKEPAKKSTSPTGAAKKSATGEKAKKPAAKTATKKKATTTTAAAGAPKKEKAPAAKKAAKPKANTSTKRTKKSATSTAAPAVVDTPKVLSKTKSGRVTKTPAKAASKPAAKKGAPKKAAAPKKEKKEAAAAPAEA